MKLSLPLHLFLYLTFDQFHVIPENFEIVPTMTFDLWRDFHGNVKRNFAKSSVSTPATYDLRYFSFFVFRCAAC